MTDPIVTQEEETETELSYSDEFAAMLAPQDDSDETAEDSEQPETEEQEDESSDESEGEEEEGRHAGTKADESQDDPYAWIQSLPEEVRKQAESLKHSALSDRNRVAAYNRHLADARRELDEARAAAARNAPKEPAGQAASEASVSAAPELPPKFQQLKEDFPEFADAVQELFEQDRARHEARLSEVLTPLEERRKKDQYDSFWQEVTEGSKEILKTEDGGYWDVKEVVSGEDFNAWLQMQPKSVQSAARAADATEALYVLRRYKQDYDEAVAQLLASQATETDPSTAEADKTRARRNKVKQKSAVPGSRPGAIDPKNTSGSYEAMFDAMAG